MTLRQPTERHGGNAGIDEEELMTEESLDARVALIQSNRTWSPLDDVAKAVEFYTQLLDFNVGSTWSSVQVSTVGVWRTPVVATRC